MNSCLSLCTLPLAWSQQWISVIENKWKVECKKKRHKTYIIRAIKIQLRAFEHLEPDSSQPFKIKLLMKSTLNTCYECILQNIAIYFCYIRESTPFPQSGTLRSSRSVRKVALSVVACLAALFQTLGMYFPYILYPAVCMWLRIRIYLCACTCFLMAAMAMSQLVNWASKNIALLLRYVFILLYIDSVSIASWKVTGCEYMFLYGLLCLECL